MTTPDSSAAEDRAAAAWLAVCDDILAGLTHALNNRLAALSSVTRMIEYGDLSLISTLVQEMEELEGTIQLLRTLPSTAEDGAEPVHLGDGLRTVVELQRLRRETRDLHYRLEIDPSTPPVVADPVLLTRALLLVLAEVADHALKTETLEILIATEAADSSVLLRFSAGSDAQISISGRTRDAVSVFLQPSGGTIASTDQDPSAFLGIRIPAA